MRGLGIAILLLLMAVVARATDYQLIVGSDDPNVRTVGAMGVRDVSGLLQKGDRITAVIYSSKFQAEPNAAVVLHTSKGDKLSEKGAAEGFGGSIHLLGDISGAKTIRAHLSAIPVPTPANDNPLKDIVKPLENKATVPIWAFVVVLIALAGFVVLVLRKREDWSMALTKSERNIYLDSMKDILDRLERIEGAQRHLVKNPPVMRTFRNQISEFETRMKNLEQAARQHDGAFAQASRELVETREKLAGSVSEVTHVLRESKDEAGKHADQVRERLAKLEMSQGQTLQNLVSLNSLSASLATVQDRIAALDAAIGGVGGEVRLVQERVGQVPAQVEANLTRLTGELKGLQEKVAEAAAALASLTHLHAALSELRLKVEALPTDQPRYEQAFQELEKTVESLGAQLGQLPQYHGAFDDLNRKIADLDERTVDLREPMIAASEGYLVLSAQLADLRVALGQLEVAVGHAADRPVIVQMPKVEEAPKHRRGRDKEAVQPLAKGEPVVEETVEVAPETPLEEAAPVVAELEPSQSEPEVVNDDPVLEPVVEESVEEPVVEVAEQPETHVEQEVVPEPEELVAEVELEPVAEETQEEPEQVEEPTVEVEQSDAMAPAAELELHETPEDELAADLASIEELPEEEPDLVIEEMPPLALEDNEEESDEKGALWSSFGGSCERRWSSESTRPLEVVLFERELKPLTPIETPSIDYPMGPALYSHGRVVFTHGPNLHGFWPGRDERMMTLDQPLPEGHWRLASRMGRLYVANSDRVRIVDLNTWGALGTFDGKYRDQLVSEKEWVGLLDGKEAKLVFRNHDGKQLGEPVSLGLDSHDLLLASTGQRVFAASQNGGVVEVHNFETKQLSLPWLPVRFLSVYNGRPLAVMQDGDRLLAYLGKADGSYQECELGISEYNANPVVMGSKLYLASTSAGEIVTVNLKKMQRSAEPAFQGLTDIRKFVGVAHKQQHTLIAVTSEGSANVGRLILLDPTNGVDRKLCALNQPYVDVLLADHRIVLITSCSYQNVVRVMEPFAERAAA